MKTPIIPLLAVLLFTSFGCKKNQILNRLEGNWEVTSLTEDGFELIGNSSVFASFEIEFDAYEGSEGDFSWTIVDNYYGSTTIFNGEYECNDAGDEVELMFTGSSPFNSDIVEFDFTVDKTELEMDGNVDGFKYELEADKD